MKRPIWIFIGIVMIIPFTIYIIERNEYNQQMESWEEDAKSFNTDTSKITKPNLDFTGLKILKSVINSENKLEENSSSKFLATDTISNFVYLRNLFPVEEIDSIEFYGVNEKPHSYLKQIPAHSLLIIYFNNRRLSRNQINLLEYEWQNNIKAIETVFKSGGIAFELDKQFCIYLANGCEQGYNNIEKVDSIIKTQLLQNSYKFERIITSCEVPPFKRRVD